VQQPAAQAALASEVQKANRAWMIPAILLITLLTVAVILAKLMPVLKKEKKDNVEEDKDSK